MPFNNMIPKPVEMNENIREEALDECRSIAESIIEEMQFIWMVWKKSTPRISKHSEFMTRKILKHI